MSFTTFALAFMTLVIFILVLVINALRKHLPAKYPTVPSPSLSTYPQEPVDPWALQRMLMLASDQEMPLEPTITKDALLYWALILEETAETGSALYAILQRAWGPDPFSPAAKAFPLNRAPLIVSRELLELRATLGSVCARMARASHATKSTLTHFDHIVPIPVQFEEAKELLDGTTDIAVVNSGFSIAAGLLGDIAYLRAQTSNLSKRNPKTGKIDKTADGKWIKGINYKMPYFDDLLAQAPSRAA